MQRWESIKKQQTALNPVWFTNCGIQYDFILGGTINLGTPNLWKDQ